jgi:heavy metal sensor kinase
VRLRISSRLTIWYVALFTLMIIALALFLLLRLKVGLVHGVDEGLATRAAQISLGLQHGCEGEFQDVSDASLVGLPQGESAAQLLATDGHVRESAGDPAAEHPLIDASQVQQVMGGRTLRLTGAAGTDTEGFRILAVRLPGSACDGAIVVATSLENVDRSVRELFTLLVLAGPIAIALAGVGGWWLARRALAPVGSMTNEAATIGIERLDERVEVPQAADELHDLAVTFNSMLDRLERGVEGNRRFAADASHELRTPLAVMRSELEVSLRDPDLDPLARAALESTQEEVERMRIIVENLLALARSDDGTLDLLISSSDLRAIVDSVVAAAEVLARPHQVRVVADGPHLPVVADPTRLEQVLTNLVINAVRFSPAGGRVTVSTWAREGEAGCTVQDEGPGVPPEVANRVFERFVRSDGLAARGGGAGLGLSISREIIAAHGGRIWVESGDLGAAFSFSLPSPAEGDWHTREGPAQGSPSV